MTALLNRRWFRRRKVAVVCVALAITLSIGVPLASRSYVHRQATARMYTLQTVPPCRVALVLGARIYPDGRLSTMLAARVRVAVALYQAGKVEKLLMSGDNRVTHYNEPERMRDFAVALGVPVGDIAMDYAGRRTYDSVWRAKRIFGLDRCIVVSQGYHAERAVFLARRLGLAADGVAAPSMGLGGAKAALREYAASVLALADAYLWRPQPVGGRPEVI